MNKQNRVEKSIRINVRVMRGGSGKLYTVYAVKMAGEPDSRNLTRHMVLFGVDNERPRWRPMTVSCYGKPYFYTDEGKFYLDDFKPYSGSEAA